MADLDWTKVGLPEASGTLVTYHLRGHGSKKGVSALKKIRDDCPRRQRLDRELAAEAEGRGDPQPIYISEAKGIGTLFHAFMDLYHTKLRTPFDPASIRFEAESGGGVSIDPGCAEEAGKLAKWWMRRSPPDYFGDPEDLRAEYEPGDVGEDVSGIFDLLVTKPGPKVCEEFQLNPDVETIIDWKVFSHESSIHEAIADPQSMVYRMLRERQTGRPVEFRYFFVIRPTSAKKDPLIKVADPGPFDPEIPQRWIATLRAEEARALDFCDISKCVRKIYNRVAVCPHLTSGRCSRK